MKSAISSLDPGRRLSMKPSIVQPSAHYFDLLLDAVFLVDPSGRVAYVSAACERILGYTSAELQGRFLLELVAPEDQERTLEEAQKVVSGELRSGFENTYVRKDGKRVRLMWTARWSEADQMRVGVARDVTQRRRLEAFQAATYAVFEATSKAADLDSLFREVRLALSQVIDIEVFAVGVHDPGSSKLRVVCSGADHNECSPDIAQLASQYCQLAYDAGTRQEAVLGVSEKGWYLAPLAVQTRVIGGVALQSDFGLPDAPEDHAALVYFFAQLASAIERQQWQRRLLHMAQFDELTGLPNRRQFNDRLASLLSKCRRDGHSAALVFIDLNDFKKANDIHGHDTGDALLREFVVRLKSNLRLEDAAYRYGGDEFIVLLEAITSAEAACIVAQKVRAAIAGPVSVGAGQWHLSASVGVAVFPDHGHSADELIRYADQQMYADKKRTRSVLNGGKAGSLC